MNEKQKVAQVLSDASQAIMRVTEERDSALKLAHEAQTKLAQVQVRLECEKVAAEMHEKGINTDNNFVDLVDHLEKEALAGRLPVIQEAVRMTPRNMQLGFLNNDDETSRTGSSDFERYLVGDVG